MGKSCKLMVGVLYVKSSGPNQELEYFQSDLNSLKLGLGSSSKMGHFHLMTLKHAVSNSSRPGYKWAFPSSIK